ncbi:MAG TPA: hypothetical protein VK158_00105 [Acidobacteriota bacterium]|nr:hypothetical protein [Acidobacteriota bacterium]
MTVKKQSQFLTNAAIGSMCGLGLAASAMYTHGHSSVFRALKVPQGLYEAIASTPAILTTYAATVIPASLADDYRTFCKQRYQGKNVDTSCFDSVVTHPVTIATVAGALATAAALGYEHATAVDTNQIPQVLKYVAGYAAGILTAFTCNNKLKPKSI